jgi:hypothetical protein
MRETSIAATLLELNEEEGRSRGFASLRASSSTHVIAAASTRPEPWKMPTKFPRPVMKIELPQRFELVGAAASTACTVGAVAKGANRS